MPSAGCEFHFDVAPFRLSGTVYGTLLNHRSALAAVAQEMVRPPYNAPPRAPVLYVKPRNTLARCGDPVEVPAAASGPAQAKWKWARAWESSSDAPPATCPEAAALDYVAGYLIVSDVSIPHPNYYRPSIRYKARDGFCPLGPRVAARAEIADPNALTIRTYIDGALMQTMSTADSIRSVARLLSDVSEFMTLAPGDVLAAGAAAPAPRARAGQSRPIEAGALGTLTNPFVAQAA